MDQKSIFNNISKNISLEVEKLLLHLNENLKGIHLKIGYQGDETSFLTNFLHNSTLMINMEYRKQGDGAHTLDITAYNLFPDGADDYEISIYLVDKTKLFKLVPIQIRNAMLASIETESDFEVTL